MVRKTIEKISKHIENKEFTIITGARQIGKSTMLKQIQEAYEKKKYPVVMLNLERKNILQELDENPENIFNYLTLNQEQKTFLLIDEIQYLADPTNFLKLLYDEYADKLKIVATGSSAFYIDRDFKDSLAGRKKIFELKTFDFDEFLLLKNEDKLHDELMKFRAGKMKKSILEAQLMAQFDEYLCYGGYPSVILEKNINDKIERLYDLRDSYLKKDVLEAGITNTDKFYKLCVILASQVGSLLNANELGKTLQLSNPTVENYLYILQKSFHISLLRPFARNIKKELVKMPKMYFNDLGLRNAMLGSFNKINMRIDKGAILENWVYRRLSENYKADQLKFWRTTEGNEVDFVIENSENDGQAIEVKFSSSEIRPSKYKLFVANYPNFPLSYKTWDSDIYR